MSLPWNARFRRRAGVESRSIDDGLVIVDLDSGTCFELNPVGADVWSLLCNGTTAGEICHVLGRRYTVQDDVLAADISKLLTDLVEQGLIIFEAE
jgi:hypothetical protein